MSESGGAARRGRRPARRSAGAGGGIERLRPRLGPRPLDRPAVDAESATAFGRPDGVSGAFSGAARRGRPTDRR